MDGMKWGKREMYPLSGPHGLFCYDFKIADDPPLVVSVPIDEENIGYGPGNIFEIWDAVVDRCKMREWWEWIPMDP